LKCDSTRDWGEIGGRLRGEIGGDWWEIGERLVGDWWEIGGRLGGRLGEEMACLALFFFSCQTKTNLLRTAGNLVGAQTGEPGFECKSSLGI